MTSRDHAPDTSDTITADGANLLFLLGLPRSGTTLLAEMLGNDPAILAPPEPWLMFAALEAGNVSLRHAAGSQSAGNAVQRFSNDSDLRDARRRFAQDLYSRKLQESPAAFLLDKTPRYYQIAHEIADLFPAARFILLQRNPVNVALSYRDSWQIDPFALMDKAPDDPTLFDLVLGPTMLNDFVSRHPDRQITVTYEALVDHPEDVLGRIYDFIGRGRSRQELVAQTRLLHQGRSAGDMGDHKILETKAVHAASRDTWKTLEPADLTRLIQWIGADIFTHWGYADVLAAAGLPLPDPERTTAYRQQAQGLYDARLRDRKRITSISLPLSEGEQADIAFILSGRADYLESGMRGRFAQLLADNVSRKLQLQESEQKLIQMDRDRTARGVAIETLTARLKESEADRAARGRGLETLTAQLKESETDRAARGRGLETLTAQLKEAEADRAARGQAIATLTAQLKEIEADHAARLESIQQLETLLRESETDRAARLVSIQTLETELQESETDRAARLTAIETLTAQLQASETNRAAREKDVETLTAQLQEAEADRAARLIAIEQLTAWLQEKK